MGCGCPQQSRPGSPGARARIGETEGRRPEAFRKLVRSAPCGTKPQPDTAAPLPVMDVRSPAPPSRPHGRRHSCRNRAARSAQPRSAGRGSTGPPAVKRNRRSVSHQRNPRGRHTRSRRDAGVWSSPNTSKPSTRRRRSWSSAAARLQRARGPVARRDEALGMEIGDAVDKPPRHSSFSGTSR